MSTHLSRRQREKIWNVINEIKDNLIDYKSPITLPLLGGLALKIYKEGAKEAELDQSLSKRVWAFRYIEDAGVINIKRMPNKNNLKGKIELVITDKNNFNKYYKTCAKVYHANAKIYQQTHAEELSPELKTDPKLSGKYVEKSGYGYLVIGEKTIAIAKINTRQSKLVKFLWHHDRFDKITTIDTVFDEIEMVKDRKNTTLHNLSTADNKQAEIIRQTIKELQRIFKKHNVKNFSFSCTKKGCGAKLKIL